MNIHAWAPDRAKSAEMRAIAPFMQKNRFMHETDSGRRVYAEPGTNLAIRRISRYNGISFAGDRYETLFLYSFDIDAVCVFGAGAGCAVVFSPSGASGRNVCRNILAGADALSHAGADALSHAGADAGAAGSVHDGLDRKSVV